jgi:hypothetical protein
MHLEATSVRSSSSDGPAWSAQSRKVVGGWMTPAAEALGHALLILRAHCSRIAFTGWPHENQTLTQISWVRTFLVCFSNWKGTTMRIFTASIIVAALSLGAPALVQAQGASSQPEAQTPPDQSSTVIRSIQVVDVKDLKPSLRSKVDEIIALTSEEDMQSLRKSVDATPEAASALKAKGLSSSQVVAISITNGVLTLFAKTA